MKNLKKKFNKTPLRGLRLKNISIVKQFKNKKYLQGKPQIKAIVLKVINITPKKPNSALRKVAIVYIKNFGKLLAYIPGESNTIASHNEVLICKGKIQDLVNVNYRIIRGPLDAKAPIRKSSRSKYGTKLNHK